MPLRRYGVPCSPRCGSERLTIRESLGLLMGIAWVALVHAFWFAGPAPMLAWASGACNSKDAVRARRHLHEKVRWTTEVTGTGHLQPVERSAGIRNGPAAVQGRRQRNSPLLLPQ